MKSEQITIIKLTASDGKSLTNGEIYAKELYLGCNDSPDNWTEIDDSEIPEETETEEIQAAIDKQYVVEDTSSEETEVTEEV